MLRISSPSSRSRRRQGLLSQRSGNTRSLALGQPSSVQVTRKHGLAECDRAGGLPRTQMVYSPNDQDFDALEAAGPSVHLGHNRRTILRSIASRRSETASSE
jgi:hypothetical protein